MTKELKLYTTKTYNGVEFDCYIEAGQTNDFWATRTQIGELLGYENPNDAIAIIHHRNAERLNKFSTTFKMKGVDGGREVSREVTVYDFKGLLEICRYSNQPKADAIMDWLWDIADEIRRTGSYSANVKRSRRTLSSFKAAEVLIDKAVQCKTSADWQAVQALDRVFQDNYGYSVLEVAEIQPKTEIQPEPQPAGHSEELWQHIVSTFAPDEWFSFTKIKQTLPRNTLSLRQVRHYLASFVARKMLCKRGSTRNSEYIRNR